MVASSNDIRTNSDKSSIYEDRGWNKSDPIPDHIYDIHQSLVEEGIIIHPEIINCSKQFISKLEPDIPNPDKPRRIKRCHYVNHCPICNNLSEQYVEKGMNPYRQMLLDNGGKNILMTFKLRHNQKSSLKHLQKVLKDSIKKLKDDNIWKRTLFPSKYRFYVKTEYEISWSEENGFHPHCHLQIGTTNPMPIDEMKSIIATAWKQIVSRVSPTKYFIPNLSNGVDVSDTPSGKHSIDKDPFGMDNLKRLHKKSYKEMKEKFKKIDTKSTAPEKRIKGSYSLLQMQSDLKDIFIPVLKEIYRSAVKRFRRIFFNVNAKHPLFSNISSK